LAGKNGCCNMFTYVRRYYCCYLL